MKKILNLLVIMGLGLAFSCGDGGSKDALIMPDSVITTTGFEVDSATMQGIINNVSSPIEIAGLLLDEKVPYSSAYLAPTNQMEKMVSGFDCAISLGILGTDLGYLNLYEKTGSVMSTVSTINDLATKLKVGQFFDFELIKRLAQNSSNLDSLIFTSIQSYNNMDAYLRENNRTNISSLIITGVWIESTKLLTDVNKKANNPRIAERIGEQKLILNDIVLILNNFSKDPKVKILVDDLKSIKTIYDGVTITTTQGESETYIEDGMMKIRQVSSSKVDITKEQINEIAKKIDALRDKLITLPLA